MDDDQLPKSHDTRLLWRLVHYLRPYKTAVALSLALMLAQSLVQVTGPLLTKLAIDRYLAPTSATSPLDPYLAPDVRTGLLQISALYLAALLIGFLCDFAQTYLMQRTGQFAMLDLRRALMEHLQRLDLSFFDRNPVGRLITRVTTDVDALNELWASGLVAVLGDFMALSIVIVAMLRLSPGLTLIMVAVMPLVYIATMQFRKQAQEGYRRIRTAVAAINTYLQEHVSGMPVLQLFNREARSYQEFEAINRSHMDAFKSTILAYGWFYPVVEFLAMLALALLLAYGGFRVRAGALSLGVLVAFFQYGLRFFRPIQDLSEKYNIFQSAMAASERVFKLLDTQPSVTSPATPRPFPEGPLTVEFDHVWFSYNPVPTVAHALVRAASRLVSTPADGRDTLSGPRTPGVSQGIPRLSPDATDDPDPTTNWVLRDVTFRINPGETIAVVGHTGAGKTTLTNLLLRFYDIQQGTIRIGGIDIRDFALDDLRRHFSIVLQDPYLFTGTIASNIRLGTEAIDDRALESAARHVNLLDFVQTLPDTFNTPVRERGNGFSTGQKQLISFARALAHNPSFLILDEATSSVDTETEFRVREALEHLVEGRTSLVIAHRLSTIQRADRILVMHKGQVRESGTHQELVASRGIYWKLYQLQYKDQEIPA